MGVGVSQRRVTRLDSGILFYVLYSLYTAMPVQYNTVVKSIGMGKIKNKSLQIESNEIITPILRLGAFWLNFQKRFVGN